MRILVVGEMSGAAGELVKGFKKNGCVVNHIGFTNVFRNINPQINLSENRGVYGFIDRFFKIYSTFFLYRYDLIVFVRYWRFFDFDAINQLLFSRLREKTNLLIFWSLSCDKVVRDNFKIVSPLCEPCMLSDNLTKCKYEENSSVSNELSFKEYIDIIVTGSIEYKQSYDASNQLNKFIPMGIFFEDKHKLNFNFSNDYIKLYHAKSRVGFKGSDVFERAISQISEKHKFIIHIDEKLPLNVHLDNIDSSNVVFDQLYNRSLGMNSLQILKKGRILICGSLHKDAGDFVLPFIINRDEDGVLSSLSDLFSNYDSYKKAINYNYDILFQNYNSTKIAFEFLNLL